MTKQRKRRPPRRGTMSEIREIWWRRHQGESAQQKEADVSKKIEEHYAVDIGYDQFDEFPTREQAEACAKELLAAAPALSLSITYWWRTEAHGWKFRMDPFVMPEAS